MNIIDHFEFRTVDGQFDARETVKISAFCYGDLGAFRIDSFAKRYVDDGLFTGMELWSIMVLSNGCIFPLAPVFKTIDNAVNFIYGANLLCNSWARAERDVYRRHMEALVSLMQQYDGYPLAVLLRELPKYESMTEEPGIRMNLNGYTPDPT